MLFFPLHDRDAPSDGALFKVCDCELGIMRGDVAATEADGL